MVTLNIIISVIINVHMFTTKDLHLSQNLFLTKNRLAPMGHLVPIGCFTLYLDWIQKSHSFNNFFLAKFELSHQKKVLYEYGSTLEFFLVKYVYIFIFFPDVIFSTLTKNT